MPYLQAQQITKRYPDSGVLANDRVDFAVRRREIHAVVGENGAGKTTLMKVLCGLEQADSGRILLEGREVRIGSPLAAARLGIGMVHQHFRLIPEFSVAENVVLGMEPRRGLLLDREQALRSVARVVERYGFAIDPGQSVSRLSASQMQLVEIVKVLYREADLLILDEPTSVLAQQQVQALFRTLRSLVDLGKTVILITHKLGEVKAASDRVTVLRRGQVVAVRPTESLDERELSRLMVGKALSPLLGREPSPPRPGEAVLELRGVVLRQKGQEHPLLDRVDLEVHAGEIVGVAGVSGNGLAEIEDLVAGLRRAEEGRVLRAGRDVTALDVRRLRQRGLAYVPADRLRRGCSLQSSVTENAIITRRRQFVAVGLFARRRAEGYARQLTRRYGIDSDPALPIGALSGGNIQKVILARELDTELDTELDGGSAPGGAPDFILFSEPTWGLDVASSGFVYDRILELRARGVGVLLISSNLDEILALADAVVVMYKGRVAACLRNERRDLRRELVGEYMTGLRPGREA